MPDALVRERLANQGLSGGGRADPRAIVSWFGAVQAQDFPGAKWAIGLRGKALTDASVERAFDDGRILRTHVLRPTWHFVTPEDIRWMIALTGPRIIARLGYRHRFLELDAATLARSRSVLERVLERRDLTRREIATALEGARIRVTPERLSHLLLVAELEALVCSGPVRDRQLTYALLDRRAPPAKAVDVEEALARLAARYFTSHGPATLDDFSWWSGLSLGEAKRAVEAAGAPVTRDAVDPRTYRAARRPRTRAAARSAWLLPNYDEYLVAYRDRSAVIAGLPIDPRDVLANTVIVDGVAVAGWKVGRGRATLSIVVSARRRLAAAERELIARAAARYGTFIGRRVEMAA